MGQTGARSPSMERCVEPAARQTGHAWDAGREVRASSVMTNLGKKLDFGGAAGRSVHISCCLDPCCVVISSLHQLPVMNPDSTSQQSTKYLSKPSLAKLNRTGDSSCW